MASRRATMSEAEHLDWWKDKLVRMHDRTFVLPKWGQHILTILAAREGNRVEAGNLKQLAAELGVPLKFVPRAVASVTRLGIVTAVLQPPAVSVELHRQQLGRRKVGLHRRRERLSESVREDLKAQSDYRCACCGERCSSRELVLDHVIPLSLLGADHSANLVPMKKRHNAEKWDRLVRKDLKFYRRERVRQRFGVRFIDGAFWPVINGKLRRGSRPAA